MKSKTKVEFVYWTKLIGHKNDKYTYDFKTYKGNDYKFRKRRYYKALRRSSKKIINDELYMIHYIVKER